MSCQLSAPINSTKAAKATTGWLHLLPMIKISAQLSRSIKKSLNLCYLALGIWLTQFPILQGLSSNHMGTLLHSGGSAMPGLSPDHDQGISFYQAHPWTHKGMPTSLSRRMGLKKQAAVATQVSRKSRGGSRCSCPATSQGLGHHGDAVLDIFIRPPDPRAVTEFSSMTDEGLNGAQRGSKVEHQESSMRLGSRASRINVLSRAGQEKGQQEGWHHPPGVTAPKMTLTLFIFNRILLLFFLGPASHRAGGVPYHESW